MLEALQDQLVVAGADSDPQQVAQVPEHGHVGKFPIICSRWGTRIRKMNEQEHQKPTSVDAHRNESEAI